MEKKATGKFTTQRLVWDAMMMAIFFVLSSASIRLGNTFKITFDFIACLATAMMFGPVDALCVGFFGEFLVQLISYGITQTTFLWMLAPAVRGLIPGLAVVFFQDKMKITSQEKKQYGIYFGAVILASICASFFNTFALYVDSKLFGYYEYHMVFGVMLIRLINGIVSAVVTAILVIPVLRALKMSRLVTPRV